MSLSLRQKALLEFYIGEADFDGQKAAILAGFAPKSAKVKASQTLRLPEAQAELARLQAERSERLQITADRVLERYWAIATADHNELTQLRREACRHCHGEDHQYQWRDLVEYEEACASIRKRNETAKRLHALPSDAGGYGFDPRLDPHPECPRCNGEGKEREFVHDTRRLKGSARLLYAGVQRTKDGLKVITHNQMEALEKVARHLGMFIERKEITGKDGGPLITTEMSAKEAAELYRDELG